VLAGKAIMVLRSEQMQSLALDGTRALPSAHGRVFWDWKNWYCYLHAQGFAVIRRARTRCGYSRKTAP
jgi:hypothetical protein